MLMATYIVHIWTVCGPMYVSTLLSWILQIFGLCMCQASGNEFGTL